MLCNFITMLRRRGKRQLASCPLSAFGEDVLIDVLRFLTRRQLCQLELACRLLAHIVQTHFAKQPYLVFPHAEYRSGCGKYLNYSFLCMWLQIRIPAITIRIPYRWRHVTLKSIVNGQVPVPAYLRFSTFEFTSYTYKMLENRIEAQYNCWISDLSDFLCGTSWSWTHSRLLERGAVEWGDVMPKMEHAIDRTKISYETSCADKFGTRKQLGDYLAEEIAPLFGANVNCRSWYLLGPHLGANPEDVDDIPLLQRTPFLNAHSIILDIGYNNKCRSASKMFSVEEILDWLHRTHTHHANCADCNSLRGRTMRLCTPDSFLGNSNRQTTREAIESRFCEILETAKNLFLAAVTPCPYQLEILLDRPRNHLNDHHLALPYSGPKWAVKRPANSGLPRRFEVYNGMTGEQLAFWVQPVNEGTQFAKLAIISRS